MDIPKTITISAQLTSEQATALAQSLVRFHAPCDGAERIRFIKRSTYEDYRQRAVSDDDAYVMLDAVARIREALADAGYEPR